MRFAFNPFTDKLDISGLGPGGTSVDFVTGNSGGQVGADAGFNIFILGDNPSGIDTVGNLAPNTLRIFGITASSTQVGTTRYATNAEAAAQTIGSAALMPANITSLFSTHPLPSSQGGTGLSSPAAHQLIVTNGSSPYTVLGVAGNGQLPIGSIGSDPVLANITSTGATITVTNGPGTINLEATGSGLVSTIAGDSGTATGSTITFKATPTSGSTVSFTASGSEVDLNFTDFVLQNTLLGFQSGNGTISGIENTAVGKKTFHALTSGSANCAFGWQTLLSATSDNYNSAFGAQALQSLAGSASGLNTAIGTASLNGLLTGVNNIGLGYFSGNSYLGAESNNILIGNTGVLSESNVTRIGDIQTTCYIAGISGVTVSNTQMVTINTVTGQLGSQAFSTGTVSSVSVVSANGFAGTVATATTTPAITLSTTITGVLSGNGTAISGSAITQHSVLIGGASNAITSLALTNGQLAIGSTGADPSAATLTAGTGITITNGSGTISIAATGTSNFTVTSVNHAATPYTVLATDDFLAVDTSGGVVTINLPNAPATGKVYYIKDSKGTSATSNITVTTPGGVVTIDGATSYVLNVNYQSIGVVFDGTSYEVF